MSPSPGAYLHVSDLTGSHDVPITHDRFTIGRKETNQLRLSGTEVSRDHAEILQDGNVYVLRDRGSSYGTFLGDEPITEHVLKHGDRIRLGRGGGADLVFRLGDDLHSASTGTLSNTVGEIRLAAALLEGLRALGPGRALDEVLALVLDAAIAISGAERGVIMLASPQGVLKFNLARRRGKTTLTTFDISQQIPEAAYSTGQIQVVTDLQAPGEATLHADTLQLGIRHVLCAPLHRVRLVASADSRADDRRLGVLYLDSQERGHLLSATVQSALETLAAEAAVAIENARLYREAAEHARTREEIRIAAEIQRLLLPQAPVDRPYVEASAVSVPCRSIGGDFFDYAHQVDQRFAFTLGDVAGKGPAAALLSALVQGMFSVAEPASADPASVVSRINDALCRRGLEARFVTMFCGVLDPNGRLDYCTAGHNPPFVFGQSGTRRLDVGGPVVGCLEMASYENGSVHLTAGDRVVAFSDGVSEAFNRNEEEFGDDRILAVVESVLATSHDMEASTLVEELITSVRGFTTGAPQSDDITAMVVRYRTPGSTRPVSKSSLEKRIT